MGSHGPTGSQQGNGTVGENQVPEGSLVGGPGKTPAKISIPKQLKNTTGLYNCWELTHPMQDKVQHGKDGGGMGLGIKKSYDDCACVEYVWLDAFNTTRCKTRVVTKRPTCVEDLPVWNYDGSSCGQASTADSEILLVPRCLFKDPFRGGQHVMVMCECVTPEMRPAVGNYRAACAETINRYARSDPWFGIEQEYTLMDPTSIGYMSQKPFGFNKDGSEPAPQGPYYCGAGAGNAIGRAIADEHFARCMMAGVKVAGINAEVMPGQWEFQVGPCRGLEMGDHLHMARYIMGRVTELHNVQVSFHPKPYAGEWNGAGCHCNFSTVEMRNEGGLSVIERVCKAFGAVNQEHIQEYGDSDNAYRLTGKCETCGIDDFRYGVADRGASIRIPRETAMIGRGYMEERRPAANCDPYRVTRIMMKTTGECLYGK